MSRILSLFLLSSPLLAATPRNFNAEYRTGHMVYSITQEIKKELDLLPVEEYRQSRLLLKSLKNNVHQGIIDTVLESGDMTTLKIRCAMIWYGDIVDETHDALVTSFRSEYRDSDSAYRNTYRWIIRRLSEAHGALQRAISSRSQRVDCAPCYNDRGNYDGTC